MECFVVFFNNFQSQDEFVDVFATREGAQEYIDRFEGHDKTSMRIVSWVMGD